MFCADDLPARLVGLFAFLPSSVSIKLNTKGCRKHRCCKILSIFPCPFLGLTKSMVLGKVPIFLNIFWKCKSDRSRNQAVRFVCFVPCHYTESNATRLEFPQAGGRLDLFAFRGKNAGYIHEVAFFDTGFTQRQLKRCKTIFMDSHPLSDKDPRWNIHNF